MNINLFPILIIILGISLGFAGIQLASKGGTAYFLVIGIGIFISGIFILLKNKIGIIIYFINLILIYAWSYFEVGNNITQLLSQIILPTLIGAYLFINQDKYISGH
jgi:quinoprotein glucose dehydrogenase